MGSSGAVMTGERVGPSQSLMTEQNASCAEESDAAVSPSPTVPQRHQMKEASSYLKVILKSRDSSRGSISSIADDGGLLPYSERRTLPSEVVTSVPKKRSNAKEKSSVTTKKQGKVRRGRHDNKRMLYTRDLDGTITNSPGEVVNAEVIGDRDPDTNPLVAAMLRQIDFAGVWADTYEAGYDQREPVDMEPVIVAVEVGLSSE